MRLVAAAALVSLAAPQAAAAQDREVVASDFEFTPAQLRVTPGSTVTFRNSGGFHNVKFEDGAFERPSDPSPTSWSEPRRFPSPGRFAYYCEAHGGPGGAGMLGTVTVAAPGAQPPPPAADRRAPAVSGLRLRRSGRRRIGVRFRSDEAGEATIVLRRGRRKLATVRKAARDGATRHTFRRAKGRRLRRGRYRVSVRVEDPAGNRSRAKSARIRLRR